MVGPQYLFLIDGQFTMCASQVFVILIHNFHVSALCTYQLQVLTKLISICEYIDWSGSGFKQDCDLQ